MILTEAGAALFGTAHPLTWDRLLEAACQGLLTTSVAWWVTVLGGACVANSNQSAAIKGG